MSRTLRLFVLATFVPATATWAEPGSEVSTPPSAVASDAGTVVLAPPAAADAGLAPLTLAPCACGEAKEPKLDHVLEVSFGTSQLFNQSPAAAIKAVGERSLPTSSALLLAEWLFGEVWSAALFMNLPLVAARTLVNGNIVEDAADPIVALGVRWSPIRFDVLQKRARMEVQLSGFIGRTLFSLNPAGDTFVPIVAARVHLHDTTGLSVYVGTSYAFLRESNALFYGLGYRF